MKKIIGVGTLRDIEKLPSENGQIVFGRGRGGVWVKNLEFVGGGQVTFDHKTEIVTITIPVKEGEYIFIQDGSGKANVTASALLKVVKS